MIDFEIMECALKIAWIKRIAEGGDASWKTILNYAVRQFGGIDFLINCDYDVKVLNLEHATPKTARFYVTGKNSSIHLIAKKYLYMIK